MKIFKNSIFTFILGAIIFGSIGVVASQLFASDIEFRPSWKKSNGEDITNVEEAIDELYTLAANNDCIKGSFTCTSCTTSVGQKIVDYTPSMFLVYGNENSKFTAWIYNSSYISSKYIVFNVSGYEEFNYNYRFSSNNNLVLHDFPEEWSNKSIYYMACK